jgi:hypothetical protein
MKKAIIIFAALCLQLGVFAQTSVPANIQKAFKAKYAKAEQVDWIIGDFFVATFWEADFYKEANFSQSGEWNSTSTVIEETDLPAQVSEKLQENLGDTFITYILKVETSEGKTYVIDLSTDAENLQVTTDLEGNILKKTVVEED